MASLSEQPPEPGDTFSGLVGEWLLRLQDAAVATTSRTRRLLSLSLLVAFFTVLLLWIAAFLYGSFYFSYMPKVVYSTPVHYYYRADCESPESFRCSHPVANVSLIMNKKPVLTLGQAYRISLVLEMPESLANHNVGMFTIRTRWFAQDGAKVASSNSMSTQQPSSSSSRSSMLRYNSDLLKAIKTLLLLPALLTGVAEQSQVLEVELLSEYRDDPYSPSVSALIEILSSKVQIYSSQLYIYAHLSGIRYWLFNFPLLSAVVGVFSNFMILSTIFILSYLNLLFRAAWNSVSQAARGLPQLKREPNCDSLQIIPESQSQSQELWLPEGEANGGTLLDQSEDTDDSVSEQ